MAKQPLDPAAKSRILDELAFMVKANALRYASDQGSKDGDRPVPSAVKTDSDPNKE